MTHRIEMNDSTATAFTIVSIAICLTVTIIGYQITATHVAVSCVPEREEVYDLKVELSKLNAMVTLLTPKGLK